MAFTISRAEVVTSEGIDYDYPLKAGEEKVVVTNLTKQVGTPGGGETTAFQGYWYGPKFGAGATASNDGVRYYKTDSSNAVLIDSFSDATAGNGFRYVANVPNVEAAVTGGTAITNASPAVVSITNSYSNGDRIRLYGTTGMLQISGMDFTISSVSGSGFTLLGLDASGFSAAATACTARRISKKDAVEPRFHYVTKVTQANNAVVTLSTVHNYVVGQKVQFQIPKSFGMTQLSQLPQPATIVAVGTYTVTLNVDSSAFTAFAFPASSGSPTTPLFATMAPAGQRVYIDNGVQYGYNITEVPFHLGEQSPYLIIGGGDSGNNTYAPMGVSGDLILIESYKYEN